MARAFEHPVAAVDAERFGEHPEDGLLGEPAPESESIIPVEAGDADRLFGPRSVGCGPTRQTG